MTLEQRKQLDNIILEEVNVKSLVIGFGITEKGALNLRFDGKKYSVELGGKKVNAPKTLEFLLSKRGGGKCLK